MKFVEIESHEDMIRILSSLAKGEIPAELRGSRSNHEEEKNKPPSEENGEEKIPTREELFEKIINSLVGKSKEEMQSKLTFLKEQIGTSIDNLLIRKDAYCIGCNVKKYFKGMISVRDFIALTTDESAIEKLDLEIHRQRKLYFVLFGEKHVSKVELHKD